MKKVLIVLACLSLGGCAGNITKTYQPTRTEYLAPPPNLYKCPLPKKPTGPNIKDSDVADYLNRLSKARSVCNSSLKNIKSYSDKASTIAPSQ